MSEWIPHGGGPMPVDGESLVDVMFLHGDTVLERPAGDWSKGRDWWKHESDHDYNHIIAYRIVETPNEDQ